VRWRRALAAVAAVGASAGPAAGSSAAGEPYRAELAGWRADREVRLRADDGWLTVAGLFWLKEGVSRVGTDPASEVLLPDGSAPARVGAFERRHRTVRFRAEPGTGVTLAGAPVDALSLTTDDGGAPDILAVGRLRMHVIRRGDRLGVRLRDLESAARRDFVGLVWFPVRDEYRVTARWVAYEPPRTLRVPNVLGDVQRLRSPGRAVFRLHGRELRLEPVIEKPDAEELFFIFRDATSGRETYPAGRFLYAPLPKDGRVVLDFNKAVSPPCAYTPYATCPLPPEGNRLRVRIEAGERASGPH
jgi:hypothetical protein